MKIVVCIRTLNEADMIDKCCQSWVFADRILIADGGSTDDTIERALEYPNVSVRPFTEKVECANGIWRNPDYKHLNFLWDWAREDNADWIISQDCDQRPNFYLKRDARKLLETTTKDYLMPVQIFLWHEIKYFPNMSRAGMGWMHGIWAHRANVGMVATDKMPHYEFQVNGRNIDPTKDNTGELVDPPYCYMHHGWASDPKVDKMLTYYKTSKLIPGIQHPFIMGGGSPIDLEDWMVE